MNETTDKPKRPWPPSLEPFRLRCSTCPNAKELTFEELAKVWGVSVTTLGEWIANHCKKIDEAAEQEWEMMVWICGTFREGEFPNVVWELNGIFSSESLAVKRCTTEVDFVAPFEMDVEQPIETAEMIGAYYPMITKRDE